MNQMPKYLDIETNTDCNLKCKKCFQSFNTPERERIPFSMIRKLLREYSEKGGQSVKFTFRGEPLLYPRIYDAVKLAKKLGIPHVIFNTNTVLLTPEMTKKLIEVGLDEIICSVDSCNKETYKQLQGNGFKEVVHNIMVLGILRHCYGIPKVRIQACRNSINNDEIGSGKYKQFWNDYADEIVITKELDLADQVEDFTVLKDFCCEDIFERLVVLVNGDVLPCCAAYDYVNDIAYSVGNIHKKTLEKIYNSKKLNSLRKLHNEGKSHEIEMCRKCRLRKELIK